MKIMRTTAKCIKQVYKAKEDISSELTIHPVVNKFQNYRNKWGRNVWRMDRDRQTDRLPD